MASALTAANLKEHRAQLGQGADHDASDGGEDECMAGKKIDSLLCDSTRVGTESDVRANSGVGFACTLASLMSAPHVDTHSVQELVAFRRNLDLPLLRAFRIYGCEYVDEDISDMVQRLGFQVRDLVDQAATVISNRACIVKQVRDALLPSLYVMAQDANTGGWKLLNRTDLTNLMGAVQGSAANMKKAIKDARKSYVILLDRVCYTMRCAELVGDSAYMRAFFQNAYDAHPGTTVPDERACVSEFGGMPSQDVVAWSALDENTVASWRKVEAVLQEGMFRLGEAHRVLEDCPDFWLELYCSEQAFARLEASVQQLRSSIFARSREGSQLIEQVQECCACAESISSEYGGSLGDPESLMHTAGVKAA